MSRKFQDIGPRTQDIERGLSFVDKVNPHVIELGCGQGRGAEVTAVLSIS